MKYYLKSVAAPLMFMLFQSITAFGIAMIQIAWLMIMLEILNIALYLFIISIYAFQCGVTGYKVKLQNDLERRIIIDTGEDRPIKRHEEFRQWKGFYIAFLACTPLVFCMLLHLILMLASGGAYHGAGSVGSFIYMTFYHIMHTICYGAGATGFAGGWFMFTALYCIPIVCGQYGLMYLLGAKKIKKQQDKIHKTQEQIYGTKCE